MNTYMLLMRGSQKEFCAMNEIDQKQIIQEHIKWSKTLHDSGILIGGNGMSNMTVKLITVGDQISEITQPYHFSEEELSGYYLIQARNHDEAIHIAKACPALRHGESVEVIPLGH